MRKDDLNSVIREFFYSAINLVKEYDIEGYQEASTALYDSLKSYGLTEKECISIDDKVVYCQSLIIETFYKTGFLQGLEFNESIKNYLKSWVFIN